MNFKRLFILAAVLLTQKVISQTNTVPGNLKELVEQSFQKYPKVASMNEVIHLNEVQVELTKAGYLPIASGDLSYRRLYPTPSFTLPIENFPAIQFIPADNFNAQLNVTQPLLDFNTAAKVGKAKSNLTTATDNLESLKTQLAYQIAKVYYGIIFLNKSLLVQQHQLDLLNASLKQINVKIQNGYALKYDLLSTQVQYTNTENYYTDLQSQLNKQYNLLNMLSGHQGISYINDTTIDQRTFNMVTDSVLSIAAGNNPDIKVANDRIDAAKWDIIAANRLRMPTVNLSAGTGFKNGYVPDIGTNKFNYYVGIGITIPILPASRPSMQKQIAEINLNTSRLDLNTQSLTLANDVLNAMQDVLKNEKKLATSDDLVKQAQTALELSTQRYKEGVNTNLDMLTAQTNYQNALLSKLQFEYNLLISKMEMSQLAGNKWW